MNITPCTYFKLLTCVVLYYLFPSLSPLLGSGLPEAQRQPSVNFLAHKFSLNVGYLGLPTGQTTYPPIFLTQRFKTPPLNPYIHSVAKFQWKLCHPPMSSLKHVSSTVGSSCFPSKKKTSSPSLKNPDSLLTKAQWLNLALGSLEGLTLSGSSILLVLQSPAQVQFSPIHFPFDKSGHSSRVCHFLFFF